MKEKELSIFCKKLSILVKSGYDIKKSLEICKEDLNNKSKNILENVINYVNEGETLSDAFYNTNCFSSYFINMIRYGEASGNLEEALNYLHEFYDEEFKIKSKIKGAFTYPLILVGLINVVSIFCMIYIVPRYKVFFEGINSDLPMLTKLLFRISDFLIYNYKYILLSLLISFIIIFIMSKIINFKNIVDYVKIVFIKDIFLSKSIIRFSNTLSSLLKSGVNMIDCINLSINILDNDFLYNKLQKSKVLLQSGENLSFSIHESEVFPNMITSMIKVGEESGNLEEILDTITDFYKNEFDRKLESLIKNIEPTLIVFCGIIVGFFAFSMMMPMYDIMNLM